MNSYISNKAAKAEYMHVGKEELSQREETVKQP